MLKNFSIFVFVALLASCSGKHSQDSSQVESVKAISLGKEENSSDVKKSDNKHVVFFDTNSFSLSSESKQYLESKALPDVKEVVKSSNGKIIIEGYCDERGSASYNKKLGKKRAKAVKEFFVKNKVKSSKISIVSYGKSMPVDKGHNEEALAKNRRAVTISVRI